MGGSFSIPIQKKKEVSDPVNEKWMDSPTIDSKQIITVLK
jgi:hypothetical protein